MGIEHESWKKMSNLATFIDIAGVLSGDKERVQKGAANELLLGTHCEQANEKGDRVISHFQNLILSDYPLKSNKMQCSINTVHN